MQAQSLNELQAQISQFVEDRHWDQFHNLKDLLISLNLESSEALELVQWKNQNELNDILKHNSALGEELADVLYWLLLIAKKTNIDLTQVFNTKMEKNRLKYPVELARGTHKKYTELNQ